MSGGACPNCGDDTAGNYCPTCGQRRSERRITFRRLLAEVIEDQLSANATLPRTLRALLFRPGFLTREYIQGRIQRYIPPFRLYLTSSVLFFLLLSFASHGSVPLTGRRAEADSVRAGIQVMRDGEPVAIGTLSEDELHVFRTGWVLLDTLGNRRVRELAELPPDQAARAVGSAMLERAPTAAFLMLPLFALLLQLLYLGRGRYYVEHFVFGLHTHAFAFLLFTLMQLARGTEWVTVPLLVWLPTYVLLAMKRCYGEGWLGTLVRWTLLGLLYLVVFSAGMAATILAAVLLG